MTFFSRLGLKLSTDDHVEPVKLLPVNKPKEETNIVEYVKPLQPGQLNYDAKGNVCFRFRDLEGNWAETNLRIDVDGNLYLQPEHEDSLADVMKTENRILAPRESKVMMLMKGEFYNAHVVLHAKAPHINVLAIDKRMPSTQIGKGLIK